MWGETGCEKQFGGTEQRPLPASDAQVHFHPGPMSAHDVMNLSPFPSLLLRVSLGLSQEMERQVVDIFPVCTTEAQRASCPGLCHQPQSSGHIQTLWRPYHHAGQLSWEARHAASQHEHGRVRDGWAGLGFGGGRAVLLLGNRHRDTSLEMGLRVTRAFGSTKQD